MQLKNLTTNYLGKNIYYYKSIDSTQKEIWRRIENENIINGTIIYTDIQVDGEGTHGRKWYTDEEKNIAFSFYIEANCDINKLNGLTRKIAEIITEIFKFKYQIMLKIKEPNDLYFNGKKIGGILTQTKVCSNKVKKIVIGIGINTNKENFSEEIVDIATSIKKEFGITINTEDFITEFCNRSEKTIFENFR